MSVSVITICNMALSHIRAGSINSLTEGSLQAQQCSLWYPILRDRALADAPWQFAQSIKPLSPVTVEVFGWVFVYQYPNDCKRISKIIRNYNPNSAGQSGVASRLNHPLQNSIDLNPPVEYRVMSINGSKVVVANEPELRIDYTSAIEDTNLFDDDFVIALSHLLASNIAVSIVGGELGSKFKGDNLSLYSSYINAALANNGNEQYHTPTDSEFITVRT